MSNIYNISIYQGDTAEFDFNLKDSNGDPLNISGYSVRGAVLYAYRSVSHLLPLDPTISGDGTSGVINLTIPATGTVGSPVTEAVYNIERYTANDAFVGSVLRGKFIINPQVPF